MATADAKQPDRLPPRRRPPRARARDPGRHATAVRRTRHAGRADRGHRTRGGHQQGADLPLLLLQGGAVRAHALQLSERSGRAPRGVPTSSIRSHSWRRAGVATPTICLEHPAFLDCEHVADAPAGRGAAGERSPTPSGSASGRAWRPALGASRRSSREGAEQGVFTVEDPDFTANYLYTQTLGTMHLARIGVGVRAGRRRRRVPSRSRSSRAQCKRPASPMYSPRSAPTRPA